MHTWIVVVVIVIAIVGVVFSWIIKRIIDEMNWIYRRELMGLSCWFFTVRIVARRLIASTMKVLFRHSQTLTGI